MENFSDFVSHLEFFEKYKMGLKKSEDDLVQNLMSHITVIDFWSA